MFHSVPYYKAWIETHPVKGNPDAPLFCAMQNKRNFGRRLSKGAMNRIYVQTYQKQYFVKLAAPVAEGGDPTTSSLAAERSAAAIRAAAAPVLAPK
jgi:hypothetical protein